MSPGPSSSSSATRGDRSAGPRRVPEIEPTLTFRGMPAALGLTTSHRTRLRRFAAAVNIDVAQGRGFDCLVTNDRRLQELNQTFLGHDYPTDVLSFPSGSRHGMAGELAISAERAAAQAQEFGHSLAEELEILMLHGVLHLMGFDHEQDRGQMAREEERWRAHFGLAVGLIQRVSARTRTTKTQTTKTQATPKQTTKATQVARPSRSGRKSGASAASASSGRRSRS